MKFKNCIHRLVLTFAFTLAVPGWLWADGQVPDNLIKVPDGRYAVCVDKAAQRLTIFNGRSAVASFPCSTGMNPGDKRVEGDRRTPEGVYFFRKIIDGTSLPDLYGWRAYVLDYPNPVDRTKRKNGDGIWIHGRNIPIAEPDTKGCVSLNNEDLKRLAPYLHEFWTPIVTLDSISMIEETGLEKRAKAYQAFLDRWLHAWESRDLDAYRACYSPGYVDTSRGLNLDEYLEQKRQVLTPYRFVSITAGQPLVIGAHHYELACFVMEFAADSYQTTGVKFVYLTHLEGKPRIINERFLTLEEAPQWDGEVSRMQSQTRERLLAFLQQWIHTWEANDMGRMQGYYSASYPDRESYLAGKGQRLSNYSTIDVELSDISISRSGAFWNVTARQRFIADTYQDLGIKHLRLVKTNGDFRIVQETWERLGGALNDES